MAVGFNSVGFPLGVGSPQAAVGFRSLLFFMGGLGVDVTPPAVTNKGDDADGRKHRGVKPIVRIRPKVERDLDDALEIIEAIEPSRRVKTNKNAAKEALAAIRAIEIPVNFAEPVAKIEKALKQLAQHAAKHEGMQEAAMRVATQLEAVIAEMERQRKRRQRDEEAILWLLS